MCLKHSGLLIKWSELGWRRRTGIGGAQTLQGLVVHVKRFVLYPNKIGSYSGILSRGWYNQISLSAKWRVAEWKVGGSPL